MRRYQVRQHVVQLLLLMLGTTVGTAGCLLRKTATETVTSDARPSNTHQMVMIREPRVEAVMTEVKLLVGSVLQEVVLPRDTRGTVAKADIRNIVAIEGKLLLGERVAPMNAVLRSQ
jgi:hypothetical protein